MSGCILILGGTSEALELVTKLILENKYERIIYSLAGRTKEKPTLNCEIRIGGFGGIDGLIDFITNNTITELIDATHPFATQISEHAKTAAERTGIRFTSITRPKWVKQDQDNWIEVLTLKEAADLIPEKSCVFLALGKQYINAFSHRDDCHFTIRMVDEPAEEYPFHSYKIITGKPKPSADQEQQVLEEHQIDIIVSRNSGGEKSYKKIEAARNLELPVIMINRPN